MVGVDEMVAVTTCGVPLAMAVGGVPVAVALAVSVVVGVGVESRLSGAKDRQMNPAQ